MTTFREQLKQFFAKTFKGFYIEVTKPKKFLLDCGVPDLPIKIAKRTLQEKVTKHNLTKGHLQNLNTQINKPILVFRSETVSGAFNVIVENINDEGVLCCSLHTDKKVEKIYINEIASIHGRRLNQLVRWAEDGCLIDGDKEKTRKVFSGSQFNSAQSEYLLSLLDTAKLNKKNQSSKNILGFFDGLGSIRTDRPPRKTGVGFKLFALKNGKLYPPVVANPGGKDTPIGVWLDADAAPIAGKTATGRLQVKSGGKGTARSLGLLAYRPGWHLGEIPYAIQFNKMDKKGNKTLFPKDLVWAIVEYAADINYQEEAMNYGKTKNGKFNHAYAGLPYVPKNGFYRYRTNPNPETDPWIITGAMKVIRVLTNAEVDRLVKKAGRKPQQRELGGFSAGQHTGFKIGFKTTKNN